ncbi:efflux RND transporter periplasmic adaptor subunit [Devosia rhodophyticola]|uniref:Efflux RND transporter periplasmic adaptor subunit n=1 Tax=Devosia rhodophyticola TaxID=3026423 RepID=A0ABY7YUU8_9HYPH|nr:efflux RND transporter periplasmic adaptor subunit [Devosia rhodophyticola]WDR04982.1 efflux RND transporter periplasmic adaptor subunit [Devosia rhodophyticola]
MKTVARVLVLLVVVGGTGAAWWWSFEKPQAAVVPQTVEVTRGRIESTVLASGVLEANSLVSVGAEVSGRIESLDVNLGQEIAKGDLIATIDSLNQENAVKAAEAALKQINAQKRVQQANLSQAETALTRANQMYEKNLIAQTELETAKAAVETGKAQIDGLDAQITQATLAVESAQLNLSRAKIVAPGAGTVVAVLVEEGQTVNASSATPTIVKIADLDTMVIKAEISEADVTRVQPGQLVYFTILGEPDNKIDATLREIEPAPTSIKTDGSASDTAIYYNGLFEVPNPDHKLRISMTAQVTIVLAAADNALLVPSSVLRQGAKGRQTVMIYDPTTEERRPVPVKVGINNNIRAEITEGLSEGERIIQSGQGAARGTGSNSAAGNGRGLGGLGGGRPR